MLCNAHPRPSIVSYGERSLIKREEETRRNPSNRSNAGTVVDSGHTGGRPACPAYGQSCNNCAKQNHYAGSCKQTKSKTERVSTVQQEATPSTQPDEGETLCKKQPVYLHSMLDTSIPSLSLRSNNDNSLSVPMVKTNTGARAFHSCGPSLWNNLPLSVRSASSVATFKKYLKTSLWFGLSPIDTIIPHGLLMLRNYFLDFAVEHWFGCRASEPGFVGDIGAIEVWLIDWEAYVFTASAIGNNTLPHTMVKLQGTEIIAMIGSGSSVNFLDEQNFAKLQPQPTLKCNNISVNAYRSTSTLPIKGNFITDLKCKDHIVSAKVHVVSGNHGSLLSCQTAVDLGLPQINHVFIDSIPPCISEFKDVFRPEVGKLKGMQVKLHFTEYPSTSGSRSRMNSNDSKTKTSLRRSQDQHLGYLL